MSDTPPSPEKDKLLGLEGLRFLATFAVLLWHYQHFAFVAGDPVGYVRTELPYYALLFPFYEAGQYGVWIFWCISGFIFFWKYRETIPKRAIDGGTFFVFRLSRLYPLHLATLLLVAVLQPFYFHHNGYFFVYQNNDLPHFLRQLVMASDWMLPRSESFNGPIWSVSVEVLVYAAFFVALRFVTASPLFNLLVIAISIGMGTQVSACLSFFYAGGLAAFARQRIARTPHRPIVEIVAWSAAIIIPLVVVSTSLRFRLVDWAALLAYTPLLLFCCSGRLSLPKPVAALLESAGNMTYSCYLLHFPIQLAIALGFTLAQQPIPYQNHLFWAAFMMSTLLAANLVYRYFEVPAQRLIRHALLSKRDAAQTSQPAL